MITEITNLQNKVEISETIQKSMRQAIERTLKSVTGGTDFEVSVAIVDNEEIATLNAKYRNIDAPTDVLSFPMDDDLNELDLDQDSQGEITPDEEIFEYDSDVEAEMVNYANYENGADIVGFRGTYIDTDARMHTHLLLEYAKEISEEECDVPMLGDIIISAEKAEEQAAEYDHSLKREMCYLTVHSVLHLLGYDHEEDEGKEKMRGIEEKVLEDIGLSR